ncbi:hypothetical protein IC582_008795 [Cucumis melo]
MNLIFFFNLVYNLTYIDFTNKVIMINNYFTDNNKVYWQHFNFSLQISKSL